MKAKARKKTERKTQRPAGWTTLGQVKARAARERRRLARITFPTIENDHRKSQFEYDVAQTRFENQMREENDAACRRDGLIQLNVIGTTAERKEEAKAEARRQKVERKTRRILMPGPSSRRLVGTATVLTEADNRQSAATHSVLVEEAEALKIISEQLERNHQETRKEHALLLEGRRALITERDELRLAVGRGEAERVKLEGEILKLRDELKRLRG
jgi:hypothetical protein